MFDFTTVFFEVVTKFGGVTFAFIVSLLVVWFLWRKDAKLIRHFLVAIFVNEALVYLIKNAVGRLRPLGAVRYGEFGGSFPSGHAAIAIFLYGFICYLFIKFYPRGARRSLIIGLFSALIVLIGFSRIYLNVHYPSDVLAGYLLGGTILFFLVRTSER